MKKYIISGLIFLFFSAAIPLSFYIANFWNQPLSGKTGDWGDFGSYLSGTGGFFLSALSFMGLIVTLVITIKNNTATQELAKKTLKETKENYQSQLKLQDEIHKTELSLREREYNLALFNNLILGLNLKLDKKIYRIFNNTKQHHVILHEHDFLEYMFKTYDAYLEADRIKNEGIEEDEREYIIGNILCCGIILDAVRLRYPEELIIILKLIDIIERTDEADEKDDLIDQFHAATFRDRTFWVLIFAFHNVDKFRLFFYKHQSIFAMPQHMLDNPPPLHNAV